MQPDAVRAGNKPLECKVILLAAIIAGVVICSQSTPSSGTVAGRQLTCRSAYLEIMSAEPEGGLTKMQPPYEAYVQSGWALPSRAENDHRYSGVQDFKSPFEAGCSSRLASGSRSAINRYFGKSDLNIIGAAAARNGCGGDDFLLLLAIAKAENGRAGRAFGVMHPKAIDTDLDTQAGWAAATIVKQHGRFGSDAVTAEFIMSLADRYCPPAVDCQGNKNWKRNVRFWFDKFKSARKEPEYPEYPEYPGCPDEHCSGPGGMPFVGSDCAGGIVYMYTVPRSGRDRELIPNRLLHL